MSIARYVGFILALATLVALVLLVVTRAFLLQTEADFRVISVSSRQNLLAEQLYAGAYAILNGQVFELNSLRETSRAFERGLDVLEFGDSSSGEEIPPPPPELAPPVARMRDAWNRVKPTFARILEPGVDRNELRRTVLQMVPDLHGLQSSCDEVISAYGLRRSRLRTTVWRAALLVFIMDVVLLLVAVWRLKYQVARQIQMLEQGVRRIQAGDYKHTIPLVQAAPNEVTRVAVAFNEMAAGLAHLIGMVRAERRHNEEIVASVPSGVGVFSRDLRLLYANESFAAMFEKQSTRQSLELVLPVPGLARRAGEVLASGRPYRGLHSDVPSPDGNRALHVTLAAIQHMEHGDEDGLEEGRLLLVVDDVTEVERLRSSAQVSEQRWRDLVEGIDAIVWEAEAETLQITFVNQRAEQILGYRPDHWLRDPRFAINHVHHSDQERITRLYRQALARGDAHEFEYQAVAADGRTVWVRNLLHVVRDEVGKALQLRGILVDITQSKRAEEALRNREERLRDLFENSQGYLYTHDLNGSLMSINPAAARSLGYDPVDMIGHSLSEFLAASTFQRFPEYLERLRREPSVRGIMRLIATGGDKRVWLYHNSLCEEAGEQPFARCQALDITDRQLFEEGLRAKTDQLQTITDAMAAFLRSGDWREASALLLRSALRQTLSESGLVGVVVDGPRLRILAFEGFTLDPDAQAVFDEAGYLELPDLEHAPGRVVSTGQAVLTNSLSETEEPPILQASHLAWRTFLGVPIRRGDDVIGIISVADRAAGYGDGDRSRLEVLASTAAVLFDSYGRMQREAELQDQLRLAQKMEAIGRLAGGIAHDFNNLLTGISGYSELLLHQMETDHPFRDEIEEIRRAGQRAAALTRQLLAFSRRQVLEPKILDLNRIVAGMEKMLRRLIGEDVELIIAPAADLGQVKADPGQLEQIMLNLAVNARDAMPRGGKLILETRNAVLDIGYGKRHPVVQPGSYCLLSVTDTGHGMDAATVSKIFEPFFTTKAPGQGTGLGLATVYGIVKQSGGFIWVYSEVDRGTTFKIYLPRIDGVPIDAPLEAPAVDLHGTETVLVAEDEPIVRDLVGRVLESCGFQVLLAGDGSEALALCRTYLGPIHLLLTDVVMPFLSGPDLAREVCQIRPETRILYTSGYTDVAVVAQGVVEAGLPFLQKPFSTESLVRKVREVLDGGASLQPPAEAAGVESMTSIPPRSHRSPQPQRRRHRHRRRLKW